jgi:hypothetical protein
LGNDPAIRGLLDIQKREDPDVLFRCETKMCEEKLRSLKWKIGMPNMIVKNCEGKGGGLVMF